MKNVLLSSCEKCCLGGCPVSVLAGCIMVGFAVASKTKPIMPQEVFWFTKASGQQLPVSMLPNP